MTDLLLSLVAGPAVAAVLLAGLVLLTLGPFVTAVTLAERRRLGSARWGAAAAACSAVGLAIAYVAVSRGLGLPAVLLGLVATWAGPLALVALGQAGGRAAGVRGRHQ